MLNTIENYYKVHSKIYDITRWSFLFGRDHLIQKIPDLNHNSKILDVGCGTGYHLDYIAGERPDVSLTGVDISKKMLQKAYKKTMRHRNVDLIPKRYQQDLFPDHFFDFAICSYSLTMFQNPDQAIRNLSRHIKKKGFLAVVDFSDTSYRWFNGWMKKNHMRFNPGIFTVLDQTFQPEESQEHEAMQGLWTYKVWIGRNASTG